MAIVALAKGRLEFGLRPGVEFARTEADTQLLQEFRTAPPRRIS